MIIAVCRRFIRQQTGTLDWNGGPLSPVSGYGEAGTILPHRSVYGYKSHKNWQPSHVKDSGERLPVSGL